MTSPPPLKFYRRGRKPHTTIHGVYNCRTHAIEIQCSKASIIRSQLGLVSRGQDDQFFQAFTFVLCHELNHAYQIEPAVSEGFPITHAYTHSERAREIIEMVASWGLDDET